MSTQSVIHIPRAHFLSSRVVLHIITSHPSVQLFPCPFLHSAGPSSSPHVLMDPRWPVYSLQKMRESGLMNKLRNKWLSAAHQTCGRKTVINASLSDVAAIFILLMGGAAFSCILLLLEHVVGVCTVMPPATNLSPLVLNVTL